MKPVRIAAALGAVAALAIAPSAALAHWDYTKWDMSAAQVIAASKGKARAQPLDYGDSIGLKQFLATADHAMGPHAFKSDFYFEKGEKLTLVRLTLKDPAGCDRLEADLVKRFGPKSPSGRYFWIDKASGDIVTYTDDRSWKMSCRLTFEKP